MTVNSKARDQADAQFTRKQMAATEGAKARAEYEAEGAAIRARTEKLRQARLARDAAAAAAPKPAETKASTKKVAAKAKIATRTAIKTPAKTATKPGTKAAAKASTRTPSPRAAK